VDFEVDEDEAALQEGIRAFCEGRFPIETVRSLEAHGGVDRDRWRELGETGVFALRLPERDGGVGLGLTEAALVFEELGRAVVPGPVLATHLAAGLVDGAAEGAAVVGAVERPASPLLVEHADAVDVLVAVDDDGVHAIDPSDLGGRAVEPMDPLTPMRQVADLPAGDRLGGPEVAADWRRAGATLAAALLLGLADGAMALAVGYAKEREQFDRPIGSFQAVKHLCADMLTRTELARSAVYAAAVTLDGRGVDDPDRMVAAAKITAGEAARANGKSCIQVHGGMGFTAEVDAHLYLKRALVLETWFGSADEHSEAVAATL
jgi:alkylation response protein AidB-like acyl-CoA dehydrogenase